MYETNIFIKLLKLMEMCLNSESLSFMLMMGLFVFISNRKHWLSMDSFFRMMFLTLSVCEGALGLSILVFLILTHGYENFQPFSVL